MKRAVLYARVSGDDRGREGRNLAGQLEMGREYARQKGYSVSAEITEDDRGASGASFELPGLSQVLAMAQAGDFDVLIPREIDRLSRNLAKQLVVEEELKRAGVEIDYVLGEYPDTPEGRLNKHIRATIAEYEREKIVERMTRGRRRKVEAGNVLVANHPPYGYKVVEADGKLTLVIDEQDARVVRMIFTWYVYGDGESEPMSLAAIAQKLTGIPTYADKYDHNRIKKRGWGKWGAPSVAQILKNQTYAGLWHYGKRNNLNGRWSLNADENLLPVKVPAIVSHELWAAAQARFAENKQNARRNTKYEYLMSKRVTCGACGYKMYGCGQKGIRGEKHYLNLYYRCHGTKSGQRAHICNIPSFRADQVDAVVWEWVRSLLLNPAALAQGLSEYQEEWGRKNAPFRERLRVVGDLITENQMQLKRLLDLYLSGEFPKEALIDTKTRLETTIIALEKERAELVGHLEEKSLTADEVQGLKEFAAAVGQGLDMMKEDFEMRRRIIETLDAQATLVIEGGQKIIYARCILSSDVCTLRPVAQVVVDTKHKPQLVLTARLVLDSAAKRPKAQIRGNRQDNTESILDKMAAFLVLLLFSLLFFLSLAYEDNNNRTGPRFVRTGDQDPGAGGRGPDRQRDRHVVVHLGQDSVVVRQGDPRPARNPFARTPWPWRCDRTSFQENGLQKRVLDLPGASRCRLSCLH